jgi:hypothetical protein
MCNSGSCVLTRTCKVQASPVAATTHVFLCGKNFQERSGTKALDSHEERRRKKTKIFVLQLSKEQRKTIILFLNY